MGEGWWRGTRSGHGNKVRKFERRKNLLKKKPCVVTLGRLSHPAFGVKTWFLHFCISVHASWDYIYSITLYAPCIIQQHVYRVSRGEYARLRENVPYVKVHRNNPKHLYPKLNGYGDNGERKVWSSCGSTYCTCFACCYPYTAHVRPSVSQPSQAHSAFIINRCHSYSEL